MVCKKRKNIELKSTVVLVLNVLTEDNVNVNANVNANATANANGK